LQNASSLDIVSERTGCLPYFARLSLVRFQAKGRVEMTSHKIRFKQISHSKCSLNSLLIVRLGPSQRIQKSIFAKNKNLKMFTGSWYLGLWVVSLGCVNVEKGRWFGITNASA
jgi:hypothetical protein